MSSSETIVKLAGEDCLPRTMPARQTDQAELYRMAFAACPAGFIVWDADSRIADWNPAAERIFGWSRAEAMAQASPHFLVPSEVWPHVAGVFKQLLEAEEPSNSLNDNVTQDGQIIHCEWHNIPMRNCESQISGFVSIVQDITSRRQAEAALQAEISERRWAEAELERVLTQNAQVLASISSILIGVDADDIITTWNGAANDAFGVTTSKALGRSFGECGIQWNWEIIRAGIAECISRKCSVRLDDMSAT